MADTHIIKLLEEKPFSSLTPADIARAESHTDNCRECKSAYNAARIASLLIEVRASETVDVGPFFKTRVMATIRERRLSAQEPALVRMWRAASALVSTMGLLLVILTGITIFSQSPDSQISPTGVVASQNLYSPEYVVLEQGDLGDDELANDQVIPTMYDLEDNNGQ
jgi:predicted anti-sigma-YlaC factor YlaD